MKNYLRSPILLAVLGVCFISVAPLAHATVPPTLSLSATGTGDNVQITVSGDPSESVLLVYNESGVGSQISSLGSTDSNGNFSDTISSSGYGITSGTVVHVLIGGTGGPSSPNVAWPTVTSATALTLTPSALVLTAGQSQTITAANVGSTALYLSNNSNPPIANASISGSSVTVTGNTYGQTTLTLCAVGTSTNCPTIYVVVENSGAAALSLSQSSVTLPSGQSVQVTLSGGNGIYQVENNSNPGVIGATISGSVLSLSTSNSSGSASIMVCSTDMVCGVVTATAESAASVGITFSNSAPSIGTGQSMAITIYGLSGNTFYVSSNSSPSVAQANVTGNILTIQGLANGSTTFSICASSGSCALLTASVYPYAGGNIALSQNTLSLTPGENLSVAISGGTPPYTVSGGIASVAQQSISGSSLIVYGIAGGTSSVSVCSAGGGCTNLLITVSGTAAVTTPPPTTTVTTPVVTTTPSVPATPTFTEYLVPGSQDAQVLALQQLLVSLGDMAVTPNGYFGPATEAAVLKFQGAHGIAKLGVVGPSTRTALNALSSNTTTTSTPISSMTLAQLQALLQSLETELAQVTQQISALGGQ